MPEARCRMRHVCRCRADPTNWLLVSINSRFPKIKTNSKYFSVISMNRAYFQVVLLQDLKHRKQIVLIRHFLRFLAFQSVSINYLPAIDEKLKYFQLLKFSFHLSPQIKSIISSQVKTNSSQVRLKSSQVKSKQKSISIN